MYNLITIKFYPKPYSNFLQLNGNYFLNKPRTFLFTEKIFYLCNAFIICFYSNHPEPKVYLLNAVFN